MFLSVSSVYNIARVQVRSVKFLSNLNCMKSRWRTTDEFLNFLIIIIIMMIAIIMKRVHVYLPICDCTLLAFIYFVQLVRMQVHDCLMIRRGVHRRKLAWLTFFKSFKSIINDEWNFINFSHKIGSRFTQLHSL